MGMTEKQTALVQAIPTSTCEDVPRSLEFTKEEHSQAFWDAVRRHWPSVAWGMFMNLATVLKGIDGGIVRSLVGLDVFKQTYGYERDGKYLIAARWLSAFSYATLLGAVVGALLSGLAYDRFGPRVMIAACSCLSIAFIFIQFFSHTPAQLFVGELVNGCIIAFYPICASAYVGEVTPLVLRGFVATMTNLAFSIGSLIASGILKGTASMDSTLSYKIPIATQWALPTLMLALIGFCPDPPYWLCKKGREDDAATSLRRLTTAPNAEIYVMQKLAHIRETLRLEESFQGDRPTYRDCFRGPNLRRLVICMMAYSMQAFVGNVFFINYAVHFMELAGLDSAHAFSMNIGLTAIGLVGTCISWFLLSYIGRRTMYLCGCASLAVLQLAIGAVDLAPRQTGTVWAQCGLMLLCTFVYDLTLGPFCYVLLAEVSSAKLRGMTIALANVSCYVWSVVFAVVIPYAMNEDEGNWKGKLGFLFAGTPFLCTMYCYLCLPETRGRTFEELDILFERKVPSRKFSAYKVTINIGGRES
ncbi:putative MFS alpha-glucoside transporter [Aspergillus clavatus NRRL 1]|uniref:MFS alpha-glucoside transporter, putative n=1 Tax=Aspergillus clavatus (strain ATCC 1007 / CBS 513.65 / DSM 816 / NCTC 3887 / NRRL 1 / QM 1276 / 107) TaxID=344612 RepID=A1C9N9_ASPCL|nr:MFS alpha-glucoside transporter, putative [Aspergillus clavatus NRRL 1]EAW13563.1 MFS alpha-glucoside transporter, putative [Aspergillus clavatus NRRL 1]